MNKEFKTIKEAEAFINAQKLELSSTSPVRVKHPLGTVLSLTATGAVMVCESRASREARKTNPQLNRTVYIAHQYKGEADTVYMLNEQPAGSKFSAMVVETDRLDTNGKPYLAYELTPVKAATPKKKETAGRAK